MVTLMLCYLAVGSTLWAVFVATGMFNLNGRPVASVMASVAMILTWPLFVLAWLLGMRRMRG